PHVAQERFEAIDPLRADRHTASTRPFKSDRLGIQAAPFHRTPRTVLRAPRLTPIGSSTRTSMGEVGWSSDAHACEPFSPPTSTTLGHARDDERGPDRLDGSAIATTDPSMIAGDPRHHQSMKAITDPHRQSRTHQTDFTTRGMVPPHGPIGAT